MTQPELVALAVPKRTTPTWEVELLISGALTIGLFQLPELLEIWFAKWNARAPSVYLPIVIYSYIYSKLVLFALIGTFVLHIVARANWVALVGVHTVYPQGPRWENIRGGPFAKAIARRIAGNIDEAIERADNRSTLIFSYGILTAQFSLAILVLSLLAIVISRMLALVIDERWALLVAAILLSLPGMLFGTLDRLFGKRAGTDTWMARQLERGTELTYRISPMRFAQPLLPMVITNVGGKRGGLMLGMVMMAIMFVAAGDTVARGERVSLLRGAELEGITRSSGVNGLHYASMRDEIQRYSTAPFIPSEVIEGAYLRLVIPYSPERHDLAMAANCAIAVASTVDSHSDLPAADDETQRLGEEAQRREEESARMACFSRLIDLRLDGRPVPGLELERHRDPLSGQDAGLAMIDVRALELGRHELTVKRLPRASNSLRYSSGQLDPPDVIVFWR